MTDVLRRRADAWIRANLPPEWRSASAETHGEEAYLDIRRKWGRMLHAGGWLGLSWPTECGGQGLSLMAEATFAEVESETGAPNFLNRNSVMYIGPTLIKHGTEAQKTRYLPGILAGEEVWCQGYSEPNAGSDLASLSTSAVRKGDSWVINGQKVWITLGAQADFCYLLARTGTAESRHRGITAFIIDMKAAGVSVRPITTLTGSHEFSEVFFDDVAVTDADRLGELDGGWAVTMTTLGYERSINFFARANHFRHEVREVADLARRSTLGGRPAIEDASVAQELARCAEEAEALRLTIRRYLPLWSESRMPGAEASVIKVMWSEAHQRLMEVAMTVLGPADAQRVGRGAESAGRWPLMYFFTRAETIYAGTSEVQRDVIAQRFLGLPRAPRPGGKRG